MLLHSIFQRLYSHRILIIFPYRFVATRYAWHRGFISWCRRGLRRKRAEHDCYIFMWVIRVDRVWFIVFGVLSLHRGYELHRWWVPCRWVWIWRFWHAWCSSWELDAPWLWVYLLVSIHCWLFLSTCLCVILPLFSPNNATSSWCSLSHSWGSPSSYPFLTFLCTIFSMWLGIGINTLKHLWWTGCFHFCGRCGTWSSNRWIYRFHTPTMHHFPIATMLFCWLFGCDGFVCIGWWLRSFSSLTGADGWLFSWVVFPS